MQMYRDNEDSRFRENGGTGLQASTNADGEITCSAPGSGITYKIHIPVTIYSSGGPDGSPGIVAGGEAHHGKSPYARAPQREHSYSLSGTADVRLKNLREELIVSKPKMMLMVADFLEQMNKGLELHKEDPMAKWDESKCQFKMLETHIVNVPSGREKGAFYAVDVGGTNFRVVRVELKGNGEKTKVISTKDLGHQRPYPEKAKGLLDTSVKASDFFGFLADDVIRLAKTKGDLRDESKPLPFGFCFSFPAQLVKKNSAILTHWTKGWSTGRDHKDTPEEVEGNDVGKLFDESFKQRGCFAHVHAVVNDTVGTLLACSYENPKAPPCYMGLILGTGSNACYLEPDYKKYGYTGKLINIEVGNFRGNLPETDVDLAVDEEMSDRADVGRQKLEKMVSGKYLGEISRRFILKVFPDKLSRSRAADMDSLSAQQAAAVAQDESTNLVLTCNILHATWGVSLPFEDLVCIQEICRLVFRRSAALAAMSIIAIGLKTGRLLEKDGEMTVAVDGSLYNQNPWYQDRLREILEDIVGKDAAKIHIKEATDGSGLGAAVAVAADYQS